MLISSPILTHKEFIKTKSIVHHGGTRFNHSVKVAYLSYKLSKLLGFDTNAATRAGILHDFFLERDDKNIVTDKDVFGFGVSLAAKKPVNGNDLIH